MEPVRITLLILAGAVVVVWGLYTLRQSQLPEKVQIVEQRAGTPALEARVRDIASKFVCSCGGCGEQPLETCPCDTAIIERNEIRRQLENGRSDFEVIASIDQQYGWLEPGIEFSDSDSGG